MSSLVGRNKMIKRVSFTLICGSVLISIIGGSLTNAAPKDKNWSQWRGSDGTGVSSETNLPLEWNSSKNIKWKAPLPGRGNSSPIVWGDCVFLTSEIEGEVI